MEAFLIMTICIPVDAREGLESAVSASFGSAPVFLILDLESGAIDYVDNTCRDHPRGMCQPLKRVLDRAGDAVVCRGMSLHGIQMLSAHGIAVFRTDALTAGDALRDVPSEKGV